MTPAIKNMAVIIESIAAQHGMHVGLTGGQLYKDGPRKDIDFVLYHASNTDRSEKKVFAIMCDLYSEGFSNITNFGRVTKLTYEDLYVDILYPEFDGAGEYVEASRQHPDAIEGSNPYSVFTEWDIKDSITNERKTNIAKWEIPRA